MNHLTKLALPLGLGLVAAFLNYTTVSARIKPHYFVAVRSDLKAGADFTDGNLKQIAMHGDEAELRKTLIPWKERAVLYQRPVPRDLTSGDIVFWRDATAPTLKLPAAEGEMEFRIDFRELQAVPKDIRAGQMVSLRLGLDVSKLSAEARANLTAGDAEDQKIGPFRVLEVGGFDPTNTAGEDISEGYIKVAVKWDDKSVERLSRAMNSRNAERLMGIFVDG